MEKLHQHTMKALTDEVHKCTSCEFKCTSGAVKKVNAAPHLHRRISKTDPRSKEIWRG